MMAKPEVAGRCGCGRSPTGVCCGWHALTEDAYQQRLDEYRDSEQQKQKLRAHSDYYWNDAVNDWALTFIDSFDMMCESKAKNLASFKLLERYKCIRL